MSILVCLLALLLASPVWAQTPVLQTVTVTADQPRDVSVTVQFSLAPTLPTTPSTRLDLTVVAPPGLVIYANGVRVTGVPVPPLATMLQAPTALTFTTGPSTAVGLSSMTMTAAAAAKPFALGTIASSYRYRIVEVATGFINDDVKPYGTGVPPASSWPALRKGQYDISVVLQDPSWAALVDTAGAVASFGPLRITVP